MTILTEQKITLTKLAQREGVNTSTVWRWAKRGVKGIRLETYLRGGRRFTSIEAFNRFSERTTAAANGEQPSARTTKQRQSDIDRAEAELTKAGI